MQTFRELLREWEVRELEELSENIDYVKLLFLGIKKCTFQFLVWRDDIEINLFDKKTNKAFFGLTLKGNKIEMSINFGVVAKKSISEQIPEKYKEDFLKLTAWQNSFEKYLDGKEEEILKTLLSQIKGKERKEFGERLYNRWVDKNYSSFTLLKKFNFIHYDDNNWTHIG